MKHKYAVYGNEETTPLQVINNAGINQEECIICQDRDEAKDCTAINPNLKIIGPKEWEETIC